MRALKGTLLAGVILALLLGLFLFFFLFFCFFTAGWGVDSSPISPPREGWQWKLNSFHRRCAAQQTPDQTHGFSSAGAPP